MLRSRERKPQSEGTGISGNPILWQQRDTPQSREGLQRKPLPQATVKIVGQCLKPWQLNTTGGGAERQWQCSIALPRGTPERVEKC